jgi:hypothetical protein
MTPTQIDRSITGRRSRSSTRRSTRRRIAARGSIRRRMAARYPDDPVGNYETTEGGW